MKSQISPIKFFKLLKWLTGEPLLSVIEPYRQQIFDRALYTFENKHPKYNLILTGRAKKNWKSADLILAALYRLLAWETQLGNQCYILASDKGQAADDLEIAKKIIRINPVLDNEVDIKKSVIERKDGSGFLEILPAMDVAGSHGKTYNFCGFDEIHTYRDWGLFEALALDPHRPDSLMWITSYASLFNYAGCPLYDLIVQGKGGKDARMLFSWYGGDYCTDKEFTEKETPEERANPSVLLSGYLEQQKKRLPSHRYRRLHLNLGGQPEGSYFNAEKVESSISDYRILPHNKDHFYMAFVDMSGGSGDDATLSVGHRENERIIISGVWNQGKRPPFDPREAVILFSKILKEYHCHKVCGDRYAGETFKNDFQGLNITYEPCPVPKSGLYEAFEVELNSQKVSLPDNEVMLKQILTLIMKGGKIDHASGDHDDLANSVAGAVYLLRETLTEPGEIFSGDDTAIASQEYELNLEHENFPSPWDI